MSRVILNVEQLAAGKAGRTQRGLDFLSIAKHREGTAIAQEILPLVLHSGLFKSIPQDQEAAGLHLFAPRAGCEFGRALPIAHPGERDSASIGGRMSDQVWAA